MMISKQALMKSKLKTAQQGITIIEVMIIIISIGIIAGFSVVTYSGIKAKARNVTRTNDIRSIQQYIEEFYAHNIYYPTLADINSQSWRATNMAGLSPKILQDPSWTVTNKACTLNGKPIFLTKSQNGCYGYQASNNGSSCASSQNSCSDYTLSATLEQGEGTYAKQQLD